MRVYVSTGLGISILMLLSSGRVTLPEVNLLSISALHLISHHLIYLMAYGHM